MSTEPCLICRGTGKYREDEPCSYCGGSGRVKVQAGGARTVLLATNSCKLPAKPVLLDAGLKVQRHFTAEGKLP